MHMTLAIKTLPDPGCVPTVPASVPSVPTSGTILPSTFLHDTIPDDGPFRTEAEANRREIRQIVAELDEWCAKVRRVDVPLPLYSDAELAQAAPLDKWRWDLVGLEPEEVGVYPSDYEIPKAVLGA